MKKILCLLLTAVVAMASGCGGSGETKTTGESANNQAATESTTGGNAKGSSERATVALPNDLPADVLILPDARPVHAGFFVSTRGGKESKDYAIQLETTKSIEEVIAFYSTELPKQGWSIVHAIPPLVHAKKPDNRYIQVQAYMNKSGQVSFSINYR